ncbi:hypothetical protein BHE74_00050281, partial [Ensete ventricosum]
SNDVVRARGEFAKEIGKLAGRSLEEDRKTHRKNAGGCWIGGTVVPPVSGSSTAQADGCTITAHDLGQLSIAIPPASVIILLENFGLILLKPNEVYKYSKYL